MKGGDLVSIIIPVFNGEQYLKEALQSALSQKYENIEVLVINDGSTDNSKTIINSFKDSRIRYFEQMNKGVSAARNVGLKNMMGSYFCFLDADDVMTPDSILSRVIIFRENGSVQFVDGVVERKNHDLSKKESSYVPCFDGVPFNELIKLSSSCFLGNTWMIRRNFNSTYEFDETVTHSEDLLFYLSISSQGHYSFTGNVILFYRSRKNSAMKNLKGLEVGYQKFLDVVSCNKNVTHLDILTLKKKIIRIMLLSYLRAGRIISAIQFLLKMYSNDR